MEESSVSRLLFIDWVYEAKVKKDKMRPIQNISICRTKQVAEKPTKLV